MKVRILLGTIVVLCVILGLSCDPSGPEITEILQGLCEGQEEVLLEIPVTVFCKVIRITATITGPPPMETIHLVIDKDSPKTSTTVPSGPDRHISLVIETTSGNITNELDFCVPDNKPVVVIVDITMGNRSPQIRGIDPAGGYVTAGVPITLTGSASDPDSCDGLRYSWSTDNGKIVEKGRTAVWTPVCAQTCRGRVTLEVRDGRGGSDSLTASYTITNPPPVNRAPTVTLTSTQPVFGQWVIVANGFDPDGDPLTINATMTHTCNFDVWTMTPAGTTPTSATYDLVAGGNCGGTSATVNAIVTDGRGGTGTDSLTLNN